MTDHHIRMDLGTMTECVRALHLASVLSLASLSCVFRKDPFWKQRTIQDHGLLLLLYIVTLQLNRPCAAINGHIPFAGFVGNSSPAAAADYCEHIPLLSSFRDIHDNRDV